MRFTIATFFTRTCVPIPGSVSQLLVLMLSSRGHQHRSIDCQPCRSTICRCWRRFAVHHWRMRQRCRLLQRVLCWSQRCRYLFGRGGCFPGWKEWMQLRGPQRTGHHCSGPGPGWETGLQEGCEERVDSELSICARTFVETYPHRPRSTCKL